MTRGRQFQCGRLCLRVRTGLLALLVSTVATAGVGVWTTHVPGDFSNIAVDPANPNLLYTTGARSTDGGLTWESFNLNPGPESLAVGPSGTVYAGTGIDASGILYKSVDFGRTWRTTHLGDSGERKVLIRVDPLDPSTVYISALQAPIGPTYPFTGVLYKSTDGGDTWTYLFNTQALGLDHGYVTVMALDPRDHGTLFVVAPNGNFKSADGGATWVALSLLPGGVPTSRESVWTIDPIVPATMYVGVNTVFGGVYKSTDGGNTFIAANAGLTNPIVNDIAVDALHPHRLYAAIHGPIPGIIGGGVFTSVDAGLTWQPMNNGLSDLDVRALAIDSTGTFLYAATGSGVFDCEVVADPGVLSLSARHSFTITLAATDQRTGRTGPGVATQINDIFGYFSIPVITGNPNNPEVFVKVLDGTGVNGRYWFFYGGLTDLEYTLTVTEDATSLTKTYTKAAGSACGGFDTEAFTP